MLALWSGSGNGRVFLIWKPHTIRTITIPNLGNLVSAGWSTTTVNAYSTILALSCKVVGDLFPLIPTQLWAWSEEPPVITALR